MVKKIVLITTGQPSINPRIVKEADTLCAAGYDVTVLYSYVIKWADKEDKDLLNRVVWKYKMVGGSDQHDKKIYFFSRLRYKITGIFHQYLGNRYLLAERKQARVFDRLLKEARKIKADWYIGHNLGALAVAVKAAKQNNAKAGFDFEDYHRGEVAPVNKLDLERIVYLENKYIPSLTYFSTASEMITAAVKTDHNYFSGKVITLLNCFPLNQQPPLKKKANEDTVLRLFWFSQKITIERGLDVLIRSLQLLADPSIKLTLAGGYDNSIIKYLEANAGDVLPNIHFAGILPPGKIAAVAAGFDIGMAVEMTELYNRNICLTNKIFTYLLAGNAVLFSDTKMQSAFNHIYGIGKSFTATDHVELAEKIKEYKDIPALNSQKLHNYSLATDLFNWDRESKKFLSVLV